jgi:hypothetical protein
LAELGGETDDSKLVRLRKTSAMRIRFVVEDVVDWVSTPRLLGIGLFALGLAGLVPGRLYLAFQSSSFLRSLNTIHAEVASELIGFAIAALLIDWANELSQEKRLIRQHISRLRSRDLAAARAALEEMKVQSWLCDGSLEGRNLAVANLKGADLRTPVLSEGRTRGWPWFLFTLTPPCLARVRFSWACLEDAELSGADLRGAVLDSVNLKRAHLSEANLEKAWLAHANLEGADISGAQLQGAILSHANLLNARVDPLPLFDTYTVMPDGEHWQPHSTISRYTDETHGDFWRAEPHPHWCDNE